MIKSTFGKWIAAYVVHQQKKWENEPVQAQKNVFEQLISQAKHTSFGKDHHFSDIRNYEDFKKAVPVRNYEELSPYISQILEGKSDVLWKGKPLYFAKTSGTTSGVKYIPISKESIPNHFNSARDAIFNYIVDTGKSRFLDKKMIFLSGSPTLEKKAGIHIGRLSGIVNHHVPAVFKLNQKPSYQTNCIEDWETKLDAIVQETLQADMGMISGIPPWVQMYFDKLHTISDGKKIKDVFKNFSLFVYGGVNFEPYKSKIYDSIGKKIDSIETFPASEGFFAYQNVQGDPSMLLLLNTGIFYEFIPVEEFGNPNATRLSIGEVELDKNYALIINSNAGLWGYVIGDTIKFVSKKPYKILFTGRIKHFISAFGEHVISQEVEQAIKYALEQHPEVRITEFSVAPQVNPDNSLPYHEWLIAFENAPNNLAGFELSLDKKMCELNSYYKDLIEGNVLRTLQVTELQKDAFQLYMKEQGKLGGQNKVPRLKNDRDIADVILKWKS